MWRVACMNESCHTCEWVMSHTCEWVMSHTCESVMSHTTCVTWLILCGGTPPHRASAFVTNESCCMYEGVTLHVQTRYSHVNLPRMSDLPFYTSECVMTHVRMRLSRMGIVAHTNGSWHRYECGILIKICRELVIIFYTQVNESRMGNVAHTNKSWHRYENTYIWMRHVANINAQTHTREWVM